MVKIAIVGYGNIGNFVLQSANSSKDIQVVGVVRRNVNSNSAPEISNLQVVDDISNLSVKPDVAVLCTPTRLVKENAIKCLELGINTVDSYDIHSSIWSLKSELEEIALKNKKVSIISAGWDPGLDSVIRTLLEGSSPKGITYTNFGPGMSMGHTVAVKAIEGVKKALSMTIPLGTGIHRRMVYIELETGYDYSNVSEAIKSDDYFSNDETHVIAVENVDDYIDMGHGVSMIRKGVSGKTHNQLFEFNMKINNPALTAEILISVARAAMKQKPGAYTMIELAPIDLLFGKKEELIKKLV